METTSKNIVEKPVNATPDVLEVPILDPPGSPIREPPTKELSPQEQQQYEILISGLRGALRPYTATYRAERIIGLLDILKDKGDLECLYTDHCTILRTLEPIVRIRLSPDIIKAGLETALADARKVLDPADELKAMEPAVRDVIDRLGPKVKTIVGILVDLNWLDSLSIDVDFGKTILNEELCDPENIQQGLKDFAEDADTQTMAKAYALANQIQDAEGGLS